jgi:hypothetical protein
LKKSSRQWRGSGSDIFLRKSSRQRRRSFFSKVAAQQRQIFNRDGHLWFVRVVGMFMLKQSNNDDET